MAMKKNCCDNPNARVAEWGLDADLVRRLVGGVKRSPTYRDMRSQLPSRCPLDVWVEDGVGFVHFALGHVHQTDLGWAVFAVKPESGQVIAAKSLIPDKAGQNVVVSELLS